MKKIMFFATMMLIVTCQTIMAQESDSDYSLKGLAKLLVTENLSAYDFNDGIAKVHKKQDGIILYGLINKQGQYYIQFGVADYISSFSDGLAKATVKGRNGYVDKNGKSTFDYIKW